MPVWKILWKLSLVASSIYNKNVIDFNVKFWEMFSTSIKSFYRMQMSRPFQFTKGLGIFRHFFSSNLWGLESKLNSKFILKEIPEQLLHVYHSVIYCHQTLFLLLDVPAMMDSLVCWIDDFRPVSFSEEWETNTGDPGAIPHFFQASIWENIITFVLILKSHPKDYRSSQGS